MKPPRIICFILIGLTAALAACQAGGVQSSALPGVPALTTQAADTLNNFAAVAGIVAAAQPGTPWGTLALAVAGGITIITGLLVHKSVMNTASTTPSTVPEPSPPVPVTTTTTVAPLVASPTPPVAVISSTQTLPSAAKT